MDGIATQAGMVKQGGGAPVWTPPSGISQWNYGNNVEGSGAWTDQSGNGNHATLNGSASIGVNGLTGGATNADFADVGTPFSAASNYSLCCWLFFDASMAADFGAFGPLSGTGTIFWADFTTGPKWKIGSNSPVRYGSTDVDYRNTWVHYAWVADSGVPYQYVNGVLDSAHTEGAPTGTVSTIGLAGSGKNMDNGFIDDVMIYPSTALSASDVLDIYNNSPGTHKP